MPLIFSNLLKATLRFWLLSAVELLRDPLIDAWDTSPSASKQIRPYFIPQVQWNILNPDLP